MQGLRVAMRMCMTVRMHVARVTVRMRVLRVMCLLRVFSEPLSGCRVRTA